MIARGPETLLHLRPSVWERILSGSDQKLAVIDSTATDLAAR
jgi:hypothetical protein